MVAAPVTSSYIRSSLLTGPKCAKISYKSPSGTHSPTLLTAEIHRGDRSMMRQRHEAARQGRACQFPKHLSGAVRRQTTLQTKHCGAQKVEMALLQRERITVSTPQVINQMTTRIKTHWISHEDGTQTVDVPSTSSQLKSLPRADRSWIPGRPALAEMNEAVEDYVQYLVTRPILPDKAKAGEFAGKACDGLFAPNATAKTRPAEAANTAPKKAAEPMTERRPHTATGFREFGEWREGGAKSASPTPSAKASCSTKTSAEELPWQYPIPQRQNGSNKQKVSSIRRPPRCTLP